MRIVDSVVLQKGMVSWEQSGPLLHKSRFEGVPSGWAPRDAKALVRFGISRVFDNSQLVYLHVNHVERGLVRSPTHRSGERHHRCYLTANHKWVQSTREELHTWACAESREARA